MSEREQSLRDKASREFRETILGPMWPGGVTAFACRACRLYLSRERSCPNCGAVTEEVIVFNAPNDITEDDLLVSRPPGSRGALRGIPVDHDRNW